MFNKSITKLKEIIKTRLDKLLNTLGLDKLFLEEFIIAGSSVRPNEEVNDWDLFPIYEDQFKDNSFEAELRKEYEHYVTENAHSYIINGEKIQLCHNYNGSLKKLVDEFDFTHVKLGCKVRRNDKNNRYEVYEIYLSDDYLKSQITGESEYCHGRTHPMESLIRAFKYYERKPGLINPHTLVPKIIKELMERYKEQWIKELQESKEEKKEVEPDNVGKDDRNLQPT